MVHMQEKSNILTTTDKFSIILWKLRTEKGLSQEKFAELAHINESYFGRIERWQSSPTFKTIIKIAEALEIQLSELMNLIEK